MPDHPPQGFDWDGTKATLNVRKHRAAFEEAVTVFNDPIATARDDDYHSWDEQRLLVVGRSSMGRLLAVSYTMRGDTTRIINARPANAEERQAYEQDASD